MLLGALQIFFFLPVVIFRREGWKIYKHGALQSQFVKHGQIYLFIIELRDPKIQAIEFVLKDGPHDRWLKLNGGNFRIEIPASDVPRHHSRIPKHPVENKPSSSWESKDRPIISPHQQKRVNHSTLKELVSRLAKGTSLNMSQSSYLTGSMKPVNGDRDPVKSVITYSYKGRYNVEEWLQKQSDGYPQRSNESTSALMDLIERFLCGTDILSWQRYFQRSLVVTIAFSFLQTQKVQQYFTGVCLSRLLVNGWFLQLRFGPKTQNWFLEHVKLIL